jgi:hypothetical protein
MYLLVNTASGPGAGIVDQTLQYHGLADLYQLDGAAEIARLYTGATTPTINPAVTWRSIGSNGGQAAAFTYDLARSIVYTRVTGPGLETSVMELAQSARMICFGARTATYGQIGST